MSVPQVVLNNILVTRIEKEVVRNGLIIPDNGNKSFIECVVDAVGAKVSFELMPGQIILILPYRGVEIEHEGKKHIVINEEDVLAIVD